MYIALEAKREACESSVEIGWCKVHISPVFAERVLEVAQRLPIHIVVVAEWHERLRGDYSVRRQDAMAVLVEVLREEDFTHTSWHWVSRVNNYHIERIFRLLADVLDAIANN